MTEPTVSMLIEVPESLHQDLQRYLETSNTEPDDVIVAALAMFLFWRETTSIGPLPIQPDALLHGSGSVR